MDKRKLKLKSSLHRDLQLDNQALERIDSVNSNKQANLSSMEENDMFVDRRPSNLRSSVLKPLNSQQSIAGSNASLKSRKRHFGEIGNDEEDEDLPITRKLSRAAVSRSRLHSEASRNTSPENTRLSESKRRYPFSKRSKDSSPEITEEASKEAEEDSDLDASFNEATIIKKRHGTVRSINDESSPKKGSVLHKTPIKPVTKSNVSQRKQHDQSMSQSRKELYSPARSEKCRNTNKVVEKCKINNEEHIKFKRQNVPPVLYSFLQKCGIVLSIDDVHMLSK